MEYETGMSGPPFVDRALIPLTAPLPGLKSLRMELIGVPVSSVQEKPVSSHNHLFTRKIPEPEPVTATGAPISEMSGMEA